MKCSFQALPMALALAPTVWVLPAAYRMIFQNSMRQLNWKGKIWESVVVWLWPDAIFSWEEKLNDEFCLNNMPLKGRLQGLAVSFGGCIQVCRHTLQTGIGSFSKVDERDGSNNMAEGAHKHMIIGMMSFFYRKWQANEQLIGGVWGTRRPPWFFSWNSDSIRENP